MEVVNEIVMRPISTIKPYIRNPRKNDKTVDMLVKIIPVVGFNQPILIDEKGVIVKGHARFKAAIKLDMKEVPCVITHADEEAIKADRLADNKISELSEWVNDELLHELDMLNVDIDLSDLGFPMPSFEDIPTPEEFFDDEPEMGGDQPISDEQRQKLYQEFLERQAQEQAKPVEITTQKDLERAVEKQAREAGAPPKYYKCVCEKCGHVMFVKADDLWDEQEGMGNKYAK